MTFTTASKTNLRLEDVRLGQNASWMQRLRREYLAGKRLELTELLQITCSHSCNQRGDRILSLLAHRRRKSQ